MIPKLIHQIYFNLTDREVEEIPLFAASIESCSRFPDYKHKLWTEQECLDLVTSDYPEYLDFYNSFRYEIQKIDFVRFCILHKYGGFYIDLDMFILKSLDDLVTNPYVFHNVRHVKPNWSYIENDFMGSKPMGKVWLHLMKFCKYCYEEKSDIEIYEQWKGRFVLQTTGPKMIARFMKEKLPKYKPMKLVHTKHNVDSTEHYYIKDHKANTWINSQSGVFK